MEYFSEICSLRSILESPDYDSIPFWARIRKPGGEDSFFGETLGTGSTIPHCLMLKRRVTTPLSERAGSIQSLSQHDSQAPIAFSDSSIPPDTITLLAMSSPGICSHRSTAHGGVISTILDEVMSHTLVSHFLVEPDQVDELRKTVFTMQLQVTFMRPVRTPGVLIVKSWCVGGKGKKYWMKAQAFQQEPAGSDMEGQIEVPKSQASGLWIKTASAPKL
jgi:hypothetical protein